MQADVPQFECDKALEDEVRQLTANGGQASEILCSWASKL